MGAIGACILLFVLLLLSAEVGRLVGRRGPLQTSNIEIIEAMRRTVSLLVPMTALVLGLLVSNGKASFDAQAASVSRIAATAAHLDELLRHYGEEATPARQQLRDATDSVVADLWESRDSHTQTIGQARTADEGFVDAVVLLKPKDDRQVTLKASAIAAMTSLVQERFYLATLEHSSFPVPVAAVIYLWLGIIFIIHGLGSPAHRGIRATEVAVALSASLALWLVFELDRPFEGSVQISQQPLKVLSAAMH